MRENSEGEYSGVGGRVHRGYPIETATDVSIMTRAGCERILRFALRLAAARRRRQLTVVTKSNAQRHAMVMWEDIAAEVACGFSDVRWDKGLVDDAWRGIGVPASTPPAERARISPMWSALARILFDQEDAHLAYAQRGDDGKDLAHDAARVHRQRSLAHGLGLAVRDAPPVG